MSSSIPRWKSAIENALAEHEKSVVFQLATLDPTTPTPHVRSHIFRGFLSSPTHPLILTTTDLRTPKATQIAAHPHVELAWWVEGAQQQFRITGVAGIVGPPGTARLGAFGKPGARGGGIAVLERGGYDWEAKRVEVFEGLSGHMKASWCRPVPGSRLVGGEEEARRWPEKLVKPGSEGGMGEDANRNWETALGNFGLVVVDPNEVDFVELGVMPNRRTRFWKSEAEGWEEEALVP